MERRDLVPQDCLHLVSTLSQTNVHLSMVQVAAV